MLTRGLRDTQRLSQYKDLEYLHDLALCSFVLSSEQGERVVKFLELQTR
jgi:hypothetical protein